MVTELVLEDIISWALAGITHLVILDDGENNDQSKMSVILIPFRTKVGAELFLLKYHVMKDKCSILELEYAFEILEENVGMFLEVSKMELAESPISS